MKTSFASKSNIVFLVFVLFGLLASWFFYTDRREAEVKSQQAKFSSLSEKRFEIIKSKMHKKNLALGFIDDFFSSSDYVSSKEFLQFTKGIVGSFNLHSVCWTSSDRKQFYFNSINKNVDKSICRGFNISEPSRFLADHKSLVMISKFTKSKKQKGFASLIFDFRTLALEENEKHINDAIAMNDHFRNLLFVYDFQKKEIIQKDNKTQNSENLLKYFFIDHFGDVQFIYLAYFPIKKNLSLAENQPLHISLLILLISIIGGLYARGLAKQKEEVTRLVEIKTKQLNHAQKMDAIGQLTGGIAHDFNNKLAIIRGNTDLLPRIIAKGMSPETCLENINKTIDKAANLTSQLLAFSRRQEAQKSIVLLSETVKTSLDMLKRIIPENIELDLIADRRLKYIEIDSHQVDQILMNLVINARDAISSKTDEKGIIKIKTSNVKLSKAQLPAWEVPISPGEYVCLSVMDNGCGMKQDTQQRIFEPFFSTKEVGKGTGLGLSVVHGIVSQNEGFIRITSDINNGSLFEVFFKTTKRKPAGLQLSKNSSISVYSPTVLYIEDEDELRHVVLEILRNADYNVLEAAHPSDAEKIFRQERNNIDLVISDVIMPQMKGTELMKRLRNDSPHLPFIFVSGYSMKEVAPNGVMQPLTRFLSKPFTIIEVQDAVNELMVEVEQVTLDS